MSRSWQPLIRGGPVDSLLLIAVSGCGSGLSPLVPGTVGTIFAVGVILGVPLPAAWLWAVVGVVLFMAGIPLVDRVQERLALDDPGWIVIDEVAAFWMAAGVLGRTGFLDLIGLFFLFRLFDIWKPWPVRTVERRLPGGLGVMADDILAAAYAGLAFWLIAAGLA